VLLNASCLRAYLPIISYFWLNPLKKRKRPFLEAPKGFSSYMRHVIVILLLILFTGASTEFYSQTGGTKREGRSGKKGKLGFKRVKSKGHADEFARSKKKGMFARLFKKDQPAWTNRTVGTRKSHYNANRKLFRRHRETGHIDNQVRQEKINNRREGKRERGNQTFSKKKYKSK